MCKGFSIEVLADWSTAIIFSDSLENFSTTGLSSSFLEKNMYQISDSDPLSPLLASFQAFHTSSSFDCLQNHFAPRDQNCRPGNEINTRLCETPFSTMFKTSNKK